MYASRSAILCPFGTPWLSITRPLCKTLLISASFSWTFSFARLSLPSPHHGELCRWLRLHRCVSWLADPNSDLLKQQLHRAHFLFLSFSVVKFSCAHPLHPPLPTPPPPPHCSDRCTVNTEIRRKPRAGFFSPFKTRRRS